MSQVTIFHIIRSEKELFSALFTYQYLRKYQVSTKFESRNVYKRKFFSVLQVFIRKKQEIFFLKKDRIFFRKEKFARRYLN